MSLTDFLVPTHRHMLQTLSGLLDKARAQKPDDAEALLEARLAPDMFPLGVQVRLVIRQTEEMVARLQGQPVPEMAPNRADIPKTLAEAQARIADAVAVLDALPPDALDAGADLPVALDLPRGIAFDMTGEQYARDWGVPQLYFHLVTAYAILRNQGVELGKADYVPHALVYLRKNPSPTE